MEKVICITGASDGLGEALARSLSRENKIILLARNESKLKKLAQEINAKYYVCDVTNYSQIESVIKCVIMKKSKQLSMLI